MNSKVFKSELVAGSLLHGIHGLRGIAALAIVFYHTHHLTGVALPEAFKFIGRDFGYSVHLFFILSAFSLMYSTEKKIEQDHWVNEYLIKRFFRIAPLFYFIILLELSRQFFSGQVFQDFHSVLLNLTFTFGFVPFSGFVWGGWSVGVEMIFYALFPVLLMTIRTHWTALILVVLTIVISLSIRTALHAQYLAATPLPKWDWSYFSPASNICFFAMGIYSYRLGQNLRQSSFLSHILIPWSAVLLIVSLLFLDLGKLLHGSSRLDIIAWGAAFMFLCSWQSLSPSPLIANKAFQFVGERSFSIYLLHPIVIYFMKRPITEQYMSLEVHFGKLAFFICVVEILLLTLVCAEFTYRLIEVPGIRMGRRLIAWRRQV